MKKTMFIVWALVAGCLHAEQTPENQALDLRARIEKATDVAQRKELEQPNSLLARRPHRSKTCR